MHTHNEGVPWTAARCHRFLRPIISKLAVLKAETRHSTGADNEFNPKTVDTVAESTLEEPAATTHPIIDEPIISSTSSDEQRDPDWIGFH
ncbi:hypothetical protein LTS18_003575, partial [Coniosporium uncinatum]